jgi:hypothetical protein
MKMEQTVCSETTAYKIQMPGYYPEENIQLGRIITTVGSGSRNEISFSQ